MKVGLIGMAQIACEVILFSSSAAFLDCAWTTQLLSNDEESFDTQLATCIPVHAAKLINIQIK